MTWPANLRSQLAEDFRAVQRRGRAIFEGWEEPVVVVTKPAVDEERAKARRIVARRVQR